MKLLRNIVLMTTVLVMLTSSAYSFVSSSNTNEKMTEEELLKSYETYYQKENIGIENLDYFINSYPDIIFQKEYDNDKKDWLITITAPETPGHIIKGKDDKDVITTKLYWSEGRFLPEGELKNKDKYWSLLTYYGKEVRDPATFTEKERDLIREAGYVSSRRKAKKTPVFFFNAVYDTATRGSTESHIKTISLFGKKSVVHERIEAPLKRAEAKVKEAAKTSYELQAFLDNLKSCDSYSWRDIGAVENRSLHSLGIAVDFLPKKSRKHLFWGWARDRFPETWMDISLDARWLLPEQLVSIFAEEGFVWGGRWVIWDNMHLEYRPEQLAYNKDVFWK